MNEIINYIKEKQKEYREESSGYKVLRHLEVTLPSLFGSQPSEQKPPEVSVEQTSTAEGVLNLAFGDSKSPYWTLKERIAVLMTEYSQSERQRARQEAIQECIPLIEKCEKTFGIINDILKSLQEAQPADLYLLVREVDIDLPLIQAKIKDELIRLKR